MNKKTKLFTITFILLIIAIVYTILVKTIDVAPIAADGSRVGFSTINTYFKDLIGLNMKFYKLTKYLGLIPIVMAGCYGLLGLYQLIKNKSLDQVDKRIIALGVFYIVFAFVYAIFEKIAINYRPFFINGELEASYPSTHTLLAICICGSSLMISKYYFKEGFLKLSNIITWILMLTIVIGRIISGVHWISDIIGGIIISLFMLSALNMTFNIINGLEKRKK